VSREGTPGWKGEETARCMVKVVTCSPPRGGSNSNQNPDKKRRKPSLSHDSVWGARGPSFSWRPYYKVAGKRPRDPIYLKGRKIEKKRKSSEKGRIVREGLMEMFLRWGQSFSSKGKEKNGKTRLFLLRELLEKGIPPSKK